MLQVSIVCDGYGKEREKTKKLSKVKIGNDVNNLRKSRLEKDGLMKVEGLKVDGFRRCEDV